MVEYLTTMRYIEKYLRPGMRILEIGAATGRHSHYLAQQGYQVDAVELVEHNIEIFKKNTKPWDLFELHRKEDIDALRDHFRVTQLHFLATDGYANHMCQTLTQMDEDTFQLFLHYHFATCEREDMVGYSNHTLDIFRKEG